MTSAGDTPHTVTLCAVSTAGLTDSTQKQKIKRSGLSPGKHLSLFQSLQVRLTFSSSFCSFNAHMPVFRRHLRLGCAFGTKLL